MSNTMTLALVFPAPFLLVSMVWWIGHKLTQE